MGREEEHVASPTWSDCQKARAECSGQIHRKMDEYHREVMDEVIDIKLLLAKKEGIEIAKDSASMEAVKKAWWPGVRKAVLTNVLTALVMTCVSWIVYMIVLHWNDVPKGGK